MEKEGIHCQKQKDCQNKNEIRTKGHCNTIPRAFINTPWIVSRSKILWFENEKYALATGRTSCLVCDLCCILLLC